MILDHAEWVLFGWVLANQGGVPVPVVPVLLAAGALAASGRLSMVEVLAVAGGATLCADLGRRLERAKSERAIPHANVALGLRGAGFGRVRPLAGGLHAWRRRGYPVQAADAGGR